MKKIFISLFLLSISMQSQHQHTKDCIKSKGYAAMEVNGLLTPYEFTRHCVGDDDILVDILYSGICHSDLKQISNAWRIGSFPMVPGHEMVGKVSQVGKNVKKFKVGDIAGVGCLVNSCGECEYCKQGDEQFCTKTAVWTYNSKDYFHDDRFTQGGYSNNIVVKEKYAFTIPSNAPLEKVGPLLCAGVTTYEPIKLTNVKKGDKVAVAGFGGLGHMAVQYAIAKGADVTVFDISDKKRDAAKKMGVLKYVNVNNPEEMKGFDNTFRVIISTIPYKFNVETYLKMLKVDGELALVGMPATEQIPSANTGPLRGRKKISHYLIGGTPITQEMIDYSVKNNIYPIVEVVPIQKVNEAFKNVAKGEVQFRYVIDMSSLK